MRFENPRRTDFREMLVNIEIEKGETKVGVDDRGQAWSHRYQYPYGEIAGTVGADGDAVDVYIGPNPMAEDVFVVHQLTRDGDYDEDKIFLGWNDAESAEAAYRAHGPSWGFGALDAMTFEEFRDEYLADNSALGRGTVDL